MVLDNDSRLGGDMYCKEQIFVDSAFMWEIKRLEKALLRYTNAGYQVDVMDQIRFCRDWFAALEAGGPRPHRARGGVAARVVGEEGAD